MTSSWGIAPRMHVQSRCFGASIYRMHLVTTSFELPHLKLRGLYYSLFFFAQK